MIQSEHEPDLFSTLHANNQKGGENMETQTDLEIGIGDKEIQKLKPSKVKIAQVQIREVTNKNQKKVGSKVVTLVKHPEKEDEIEISSVKYEKKGKLEVSGLWFNKDAEDKIVKGSALAVLLQFLGCANINALVGREPETVEDDSGYLCLKAY